MSAKSRQPKKGKAGDKRQRKSAAPRRPASATTPPASVVLLTGVLLSVPGMLKMMEGRAQFSETLAVTVAAFVVGWLLIAIVYQVVGSFIDAMPPPAPPAPPSPPNTVQPIPTAFAEPTDVPFAAQNPADLPRVEGLGQPAEAQGLPGQEQPPT